MKLILSHIDNFFIKGIIICFMRCHEDKVRKDIVNGTYFRYWGNAFLLNNGYFMLYEHTENECCSFFAEALQLMLHHNLFNSQLKPKENIDVSMSRIETGNLSVEMLLMSLIRESCHHIFQFIYIPKMHHILLAQSRVAS